MMTLLSKGLGLVIGPLLIPLLAAFSMWAGGKYLEMRDERAMLEGRRLADAAWEQSIRDEERAAAARQAATARAVLDAERLVAEDLRTRLETIAAEADGLRATVSGAGGRCLSDGVYDALNRYAGPGT